MTDLMVRVERVVRPVRATGSRKLKMREELLAHLTAIRDEERAKHGDDAAALPEALRRFGDPAELTKELQDTVPRYERLLCRPLPGSDWEWRAVRWFCPRPGEGAVRHAARVAAAFAGYFLALLLLTAAVMYATGASRPFLEIDVAAVITAHAFVSGMLFVGLLRATFGRPTAQSLLAAVGCGLPLLAGGPALIAALTAVQPDNPLWRSGLPHADELVQRTVLAGLFWLVAIAVVFRVAFARQRRILEWMELKLEA
jgi:hypothetical protein